MEAAANGEAKTLLPVENVQALAASKNPVDIPERYIRPEIASEVTIVANGDDIPIVDLGKLLDPRSSADEAAKLKMACEDWGFFQLINHGVPEEVIESLKVDLQEFFQRPLKEKKSVEKLQGDREGYGKKFVLSDDQKLDWGDVYFLKLRPVANRNMRFWPTHPSTFRTTLDKYSNELKKIVDCLLIFMAKNLGIHSEKLVDIFEDSVQNAGMNYYPLCHRAGEVLGISPHSDHTGLTLLLQVNGVQGLQIRRNYGWLPIKPIHGTFVVNIGDILEILSNGKYKSIEHRATVNPDKERVSIAVFHRPKDDAPIGPLPELVGGGVEHYRSLTVESYMRLSYSTKLDGKNILDQLKI